MTTTATPLRLEFNPQGDALDAARACEAEIFSQTYGNTPAEFAVEYGPYDDATVFLTLAEENGDVVAASRLIMPSAAGLKTLNDIGRPPWSVDGLRSARAARIDPSRTLDVATIGVRADAGASRMFAAVALYHGIAIAARVNRIETFVMVLDERVRRLVTAMGLMTQALPGTHAEPYLGSPASAPLYGNLAQMADFARRVNPETHRLIGQGVGLDGVSVPALSAFQLGDLARPQPAAVGSPSLATRA
jgi:hypothetical protein